MVDKIISEYTKVTSKGKVIDLDKVSKLVEDEEEFNEILLFVLDKNNGYSNITLKEAEDVENVGKADKKEEAKVDDPVKAYLKEIGRIPLFTPKEEIEIFSKLSEKIPGSNEYINIANKIAESNLRLVVSVAKRYTGRGMDILDLIQEGNIGLMKAVEKFDVTRKIKFSSYATCWIKNQVLHAISDKSGAIRLPAHVYERVKKYAFNFEKLFLALRRKPTDLEMIKEYGYTLEELDELKEYQKISDLTSLDMLIGEDKTLGDFISGTDTNEESFLALQQKEMLNEAFERLRRKPNGERLVYVTKERYGINRPKRTLEDIAKDLGVTRQRVGQMQKKAEYYLSRDFLLGKAYLFDDEFLKYKEESLARQRKNNG